MVREDSTPNWPFVSVVASVARHPGGGRSSQAETRHTGQLRWGPMTGTQDDSSKTFILPLSNSFQESGYGRQELGEKREWRREKPS